jgi:hypothetical protein
MRRSSPGGRALLVMAAIIATLGLAACDNTPDDTGTTPTTPTDPLTETFSGTINVNGAATHPFNVGGGGTVTVTLTAITPADGVAGLSLGTFNGALCQIVLANDSAVQGNVMTGTVSSIGALCVRFHDTGKLIGATDYTLTVVHP